MKLGVLTLHHQYNYGGVLQAFASKMFLEKSGHQVLFIGSGGVFNKPESLKRKGARRLKWFIRFLLQGTDLLIFIRKMRTDRFIEKEMSETALPIYLWKTVTDTEAIDTIVVGSDQVWNVSMLGEQVKAYFPTGLKRFGVRLVSYAASIGLTQIEQRYAGIYQTGLSQFDAVSVRERESIALLQAFYHGHIRHVCDPTLLLTAQEWKDGLKLKRRRNSSRCIAFYALDVTDAFIHEVLALSKRECIAVEIYTDIYPPRFKRSVSGFLQFKLTQLRICFSRVRIRRAAGPREFVQGIYDSAFVIADSFHALMFATIFKRPVRIVVNQDNEYRVKMSARVVEFMKQYYDGAGLCNSWHTAITQPLPDAVLKNTDLLKKWISLSSDWFLRSIGRS